MSSNMVHRISNNIYTSNHSIPVHLFYFPHYRPVIYKAVYQYLPTGTHQ